MLKLKLQYFGHLMWRTDSSEKTLMLGKIWGQEEKGMTEDEMAGWHHQLNGHESEWTPGVGDGQGGLVCCGSWGRRELDTSERMNWSLSWFSPFGKRDFPSVIKVPNQKTLSSSEIFSSVSLIIRWTLTTGLRAVKREKFYFWLWRSKFPCKDLRPDSRNWK